MAPSLPLTLPFPPATIALACVATVLVLLKLWRRRGSDVHLVPGPSGGHWMWGHEREIAFSEVSSKYTTWFREYGPVVRHKGALLHPDILSVADPKALKYILTDNYMNFTKSLFLRPLVDRLMGQGIVWAEGDQHKRFRKALAPAFSPSNLRNMTTPIFDIANSFRYRLANYVQEKDGFPTLDINEWVSSFALDVVCKLQFNHDTQGGTSADAQAITLAWNEQINEGLKPTSFYGLLIIRMFPFLGRLPLSYFKAQSDIKDILSRNSQNYVDDNKGVVSSDPTFIALLLKNMKANGATALTMKEVIENINTLLIGGFETTSGTIKMAIYELAKNQEIQQRLRDEVSQFEGEPNYEDLMVGNGLPYLDAVVKESLRCHPTGGTTDRVATEDDVIPLGTPIELPNGEKVHEIRIKAGQLIQIPMRAINIWEDGEEFDPSRWMRKERLPGKVGGFSNISSFSEGPRMCIGYKLAILEMKIILFTLLKSFMFYDSGARIETRISTTYQTRVIGKEEEGAQLPLRVALCSESEKCC